MSHRYTSIPYRKVFNPSTIRCPKASCKKVCKTHGGLRQHIAASHPTIRPRPAENPLTPPPNSVTPPPFPPADASPPSTPLPQGNATRRATPQCNMPPNPTALDIQHHPILDGTPCNEAKACHESTCSSPPPWEERAADDYSPYLDRAEFEFADFLYSQAQMSGGNIDKLSQLLAALYPERNPPFADRDDLYRTIDATQHGDIPWDSFTIAYTGEVEVDSPPWKLAKYETWFRDPLKVMEQQIGNRDFAGEMDFAPKRIFKNGERQYTDLMSGNWAWEQADKISEDEETHGAVFAPVILGSDKTTVSVATGQNDYYPLYASTGLVHNGVRRAHRNTLSLVAFLAIPKTSQEHKDDPDFRQFRRRLFHTALHRILLSLCPHMLTPRVTRCADGHFRRIIYGLGPYIADYPEQVLLSCIVQGWCACCTSPSDNLDAPSGRRSHEHTHALFEACSLQELWDNYGIIGDILPFTAGFPRADIHELISPDLLHQVIKGSFKDHLVEWVTEYVKQVNEPAEASKILADIDRRIAAAPSFPTLRRFPKGRGFSQWTGDDSKALMKVYIPAIVGHVPDQMVSALSAFTEFCYLVRQHESTLTAIDNALEAFHHAREIFRVVGIRIDGFSLPRQHSLLHYRYLIQMFGAPNGLCSSITESKHIKAVKQPWRRSNRNKPLGQMLLTNQQLDKLAAARVEFEARGMLDGPCLAPETQQPPAPPPEQPQPEEVLEEEDNGGIVEGTACLGDNPDSSIPGSQIELDKCPEFNSNVYLYPSAIATFYAPSDISGINGMYRERIHATRSWRHGPPRYDCVFIEKNPDINGFRGLHVARVFGFFSFTYGGEDFPCALVHWFSPTANAPCPKTLMWTVTPDVYDDGSPRISVVHIDCIFRGAHLMGMAGDKPLPYYFTLHHSLDGFETFYVNKFIDHHAHEIAF
ncbi:hypothetical protein BD779DRAFT_1613631 [Infundibulicybe gibba]|nr:hypothetical protein BD779DRAFT_1613631 [Infundibulicybe gibba]